ncbi:Type 1 glutamine amidotransferase-like domain-containing protein [Sphaerimonospora cavernae]|uniref:Type 1 glutamine amidotransferase-like domain-containing protein n=1 Tax=Sphaerimonospora cavernae TaxID=1740611 RepID=A0ABV6U671_9ACTN
MASPQGIVLLGGGFSDDPDTLLDDFVLEIIGTKRPRICFVPTASGDSAGYVERFHAAFSLRDCLPVHLPLFRREHRDLREFVLAQDVVYVGGGNTANLLAVWRLHGLDVILREAYAAGVLLCGISAGAACWFDACLTDSFGPVTSLHDGLGFIRGSFCPHYDGEADRRPAYRGAVGDGILPPGWALDDGAAAHFLEGVPIEVVSRRPNATLHRVAPDPSGVGETVSAARLLIPSPSES